MPAYRFQSLLGFLMRCDTIVSSSILRRFSLFQSLLGFLMRCDPAASCGSRSSLMFQSLLGFLMRCDILAMRSLLIIIPVSIPAGFSDALRQFSSICEDLGYARFQSLLGFLMRCDRV